VYQSTSSLLRAFTQDRHVYVGLDFGSSFVQKLIIPTKLSKQVGSPLLRFEQSNTATARCKGPASTAVSGGSNNWGCFWAGWAPHNLRLMVVQIGGIGRCACPNKTSACLPCISLASPLTAEGNLPRVAQRDFET
jgi:hypothetical protein